MKYVIVPLETVNALVTEPSRAFGIAGRADIVVISVASPPNDWGTELDDVVDGCLVLGFNKLVLDLEQTQISSSFLIACIASAWQRLIDNDGTLAFYGLSKSADEQLRGLIDPALFNIFGSLDECIDWLESEGTKFEGNFPRPAQCAACGVAGQVGSRGEHVCAECGTTYLVTERGELLF